VTVAYGVDVGATSIKSAAVGADGGVLGECEIETPDADVAALERAVLDAVETVRAGCPGGTAVGIGVPGWAAADRRVVRYTPNLPWRDEPLADRIERATGLSAFVENDANAAAWAEFRFGSGRAVDSMVMLTLGSGVGSAIVVGGRLVRGGTGRAGEIGHCVIETGGRPCACGRVGCMENYASGRALNRGVPAAVTAERTLSELAGAGDERALAAYREYGEHIGRGLADVVLTLDPELIVFGGGVSDSFERFGPAVVEALTDELGPHWGQAVPVVRRAELGPAAGRIGAADLARTD